MITVGTWNVENLFRPGGDSGPRDQAAYDAKLDALAAAISAIEPDVLAVQEVGDPEALADLLERLGGTWHTRLSEFPDGRGIRVGVLSTLPLTSAEDVVELADGLEPPQVGDDGDVATRTGRGLLGVRVRTPDGTDVDVLTAHLKSKLLSYPGGRFQPRDEDERARYAAYALYLRSAEATTLRGFANRVVEGEGRERAVVVCGDLNDEVAAATTTILLGPGGSEIGTPGHERPDQGDAWRLWNLAPLIPADQRYSRVYQGRRELIDHVLVSHALLDHVDTVTTVVGEGLPSVADDPRPRRDATASDHAPVVARLTV